jgi:anti-sigma regulatory factor (Ser/Thr protein kinase)/serine/threonine protein phosphatase PrpC
MTSADTVRREHVVDIAPDVLIAAAAATSVAAQLGFAPQECSEIALAVRELATNILRHAGRGAVEISGRDGTITIVARDHGPGVVDREAAQRDGYSTVGGLGYGLGTVNRSMDDLRVESDRTGTTVTARRSLRPTLRTDAGNLLDVGVATVPLFGQVENGDDYIDLRWGTYRLVGVIDGIGHGPLAHAAARAARTYVEHHFDQPLDAIFRGADVECRGSRGVVMALARLDWERWQLEFASVGNIEARVLHAGTARNLIARRGIVGLMAPPPTVSRHDWQPDATLIVHSDGIPSHWGAGVLDDLLDASASVLARTILTRLRKATDDATVLVMKRGGS